jgi:hypothetical protein
MSSLRQPSPLSQPPVYADDVARISQHQLGGPRRMSRNYRDRAVVRLSAGWRDQALRRANSTKALATWLEEDNSETAPPLDLYSKRGEDVVERYRRQRLILAWIQDKPTGTLQ